MEEIRLMAPKILRETRENYGYTQKEVAKWIGISRSNYCRKEKVENGVTVTADEFLIIMKEFQERGPKKKNKKSIQKLLDGFNL